MEFLKILFVSFKSYFWHEYKKSTLVLGPTTKIGIRDSKDKANIGNLKVNRGCHSLIANRTSADCVENTPGPSVHHIPMGSTILGVSMLCHHDSVCLSLISQSYGDITASSLSNLFTCHEAIIWQYNNISLIWFICLTKQSYHNIMMIPFRSPKNTSIEKEITKVLGKNKGFFEKWK